MGTIEEVKGALKELDEKKAKLNDIGKTCADKKKISPKDCYLE